MEKSAHLIYLLTIVAMLSTASQAATIPLVNSGFEQPDVGKIEVGFDGAPDVPGWNSSTAMVDSGINDPAPNPGRSGTYCGYLMGNASWKNNNIPDGPMWQTTSHVITAGKTFYLSFYARTAWSNESDPQLTAKIYYDDAGTRQVMGQTTLYGLPSGSWTFGSFMVVADDYPASIGKNIGVELECEETDNSGGTWIDFDDIELVESGSGVNFPPTVDAGSSQSISFDQTNSATLNATIFDDNPNNLGQIGVDYGTVQWSCPANPAVSFADTSDPQTTVTFPSDGYYTLQLYVEDDAANVVTDTVMINMFLGDEFRSRAATLVSQMSLSQKISQMDYTSPSIPSLGLSGYNYWSEALHGVARQGLATVFPQCVGMASMWDDALLKDIFSAVSDEARVRSTYYGQGLSYWTPNINLARDPRWGRNEETYGEDPYLLSRMAVAVVQGLQGDDPKYLKTIATAKHFIANNSEAGRHNKSSDMDERNLREFYMPAFKAAVTEGNVTSVMAAYNALNGVPCAADGGLLTDVLRAEWGFDGYLVSDCGAIGDIYTGGINPYPGHFYASSARQAAEYALNAGVDLNCYISYTYYESELPNANVTEAQIDNALTNILTARFRLGEFDDPSLVPYTDPSSPSYIPASELDSQAHRDLALLAARKSMVLLKNDGILPLDAGSINSVALIGPNADVWIDGGYSGTPPYGITPRDGIEAKIGASKVTYQQGCSIDGGWVTIPSGSLSGLSGEYFNSMDLSGSVVRTDSPTSINFNWGTASPGAGVNSDGFSARWTGVLTAPATRDYLIGMTADDGCRLYIDGVKVFENWTSHAPKTTSAWVHLNAGQKYDIVMEYYEDWGGAEVYLVWDYGISAGDASALASAASLAASSDVAIVCVGTDLNLSNEESDISQCQFHGLQERLIKEVYAANSNTIVVLVNGNPIGFEWTADHVPAILEAWYAGQSQGTAIADVLFGDYNPGGKLPQTFYKREIQLPHIVDDYDIINGYPGYAYGGRTYQYFTGDVQYPFGHGLSYTSFAYSNLSVTPNPVSATGTVTVEFDVENTGSVAGDEVAQVYLHDVSATVKTPIKQLRGFKRITLDPSDSQHLSFDIPVSDIGYWDEAQYTFVVEDGVFNVMVGSSSADIRLNGSFTVGAVSNNLPNFNSNPLDKPNATVYVPYSDTIAGSATDPDAGDTLTYSKLVGGPAWLSVTAGGALSGTPSNSDLGANSWTVQVSDGNGGIDTATLNISVDLPPVDIDNSGSVDTGDLLRIALEWLSTGCYATTDMCNGADLDGSDSINLGDVSALAQHWLETQ